MYLERKMGKGGGSVLELNNLVKRIEAYQV